VGINSSDPNSQPRHAGERHPDGDEVLILLTGRLEVHIEEEDGNEAIWEVKPGEAIVVPQGVWHRLRALEESRFINTPGPSAKDHPLD
jgi:quercetin dioxygenase-like cupin family protein